MTLLQSYILKVQKPFMGSTIHMHRHNWTCAYTHMRMHKNVCTSEDFPSRKSLFSITDMNSHLEVRIALWAYTDTPSSLKVISEKRELLRKSLLATSPLRSFSQVPILGFRYSSSFLAFCTIWASSGRFIIEAALRVASVSSSLSSFFTSQEPV